jgi:hypothetical protein
MPSLQLQTSSPSLSKLAPNYAFKPTAGEVIRFNRPLWTGGGLTRRWAAQST